MGPWIFKNSRDVKRKCGCEDKRIGKKNYLYL